MQSLIAYFRVSTQRQGRSGLGLEAQQEAAASYARSVNLPISAVYIEVETGKGDGADRPELAKAIGHARRAKATLVVGKLDRLARNVAFVSALMESDVEFVACDNPHANRLTLHILAAVAEWEAQTISQRTKDALQAAKQRGTLLGSARPGHWDGREEARREGARKGRERSAEVRSAKAATNYADLLPLVQGMREQGLSLAVIAQRLNDKGQRTVRGKEWSAMQVSRLLDRN